jgi:hypothetical protein
VRPLPLLALLAPLALAGILTAQPKAAQPEKPRVTINLADPQAALNTYFEAQKANDLKALLAVMHISKPDMERYVTNVVTYQMWKRYLERQAITKFGKEDGMRVFAHVRSLDDQTDLDIKRAKEAGVEYDSAKTTARLFLRVERGRPDNLQSDRFAFLDAYNLVKTKDGWKIDFLKTFKSEDPEQNELYMSENTAFPRMSVNVRKLSEQLKEGRYKTADDLKNKLDSLWATVYDAPVDASGRTAAETQAASETKPAE